MSGIEQRSPLGHTGNTPHGNGGIGQIPSHRGKRNSHIHLSLQQKWSNLRLYSDRKWRREADQPVVFVQANGHGTGHDLGGYGTGAWYWAGDWLINAWGDYSSRYSYGGTAPPWRFAPGKDMDLCNGPYSVPA